MLTVPSLFSRHFWLYFSLAAIIACQVAGQSPEALSQYFEGKQVIVKLDMPGSQKGIDIYPDKPQPLDTKSYSNRIKSFGVSLRNGDTVMITKVKVKSDNLEFQLGGGGYGTAGDTTDNAVHFTPADKSSREKELEDQLRKETNDDRRRSLSRELDNLRRDRERQDRRNRAMAEQDADWRRQKIATGREGGGSRFNIHFKTRNSGDAPTPQMVMNALAQYVSFSPETFGPNRGRFGEGARDDSAVPPQSPSGDPAQGLKKGLTRAQVESLFGPPTETHDRTQGGLIVNTCTYQNATETVQADFVNGVLVQYTVSSR